MTKNIIISVIMASCVLGACDDMNSINQKYFDEGEKIYICIPDSLTIIPGNERAKVRWKIDADPKLKDCVISWGTNDSVVTPIERVGRGAQWLETIIPNVPEGSLIFTAYLRDIYGNKSLLKEKSQMIYGPEYFKDLTPRKFSSMEALASDRLLMKWNTIDNCVGVNLHYKNRDNKMKTVKIEGLQTEVTLTDFVLNGTFTYETLYQPYNPCLDTLTVASQEFVFPEKYSWDGSGWNTTLSDYASQEGGGAANLFDKDFSSYWHSAYNSSLPHWILSDMGEMHEIHEVQIYKRENNTDCKEVEIQLSQDGVEFTTVGKIQFEQKASPNSKSLILETPVKAKYLKCVVTQSWRAPHVSLSEIKVVGL